MPKVPARRERPRPHPQERAGPDVGIRETAAAAVAAFQSGDLARCRGIIEASPLTAHSPDLNYILGVCLLRVRQAGESLAHFDRALALKPDFANAWSNRGLALKELGRLEEALTCHDRALAVRPAYAEAWCNRGIVLQDLGRKTEALASQEQAIALKHAFPEAWSNRGSLLHDLGRSAEALVCYDTALSLAPASSATWYNRAVALRDLGRRQDALASYDKAIALTRDYPQAWCNRGNVLAELGRWGEALASYDEALRLWPAYADAWYNKGNALREEKRTLEALAAYDTALAHRPHYPEALCNRANALRELGQLEAALLSSQAALRQRPRYAAAWHNRGLILYDLLRAEEAVAAFDEALALQDIYPEAWTSRGVVMRDMMRAEEALACFDKATAQKPEAPEAWSNRAAALQDLERLEDALASCDRAIELRPSYAEAWSNRGIVLLALGRAAESIASFERALSFDGASPTIGFNLAVARLYSGDFERGLAGYECRWHRDRPEKPLIAGPWPLWQGEPLEGRTIVVHFEQGLGDALQFVRYLPLLAARGGHVIFVIPAKMHRILSASLRGIDVRTDFAAHDAADFHLPLMSLPHRLGTRLETIPAAPSYLAAPPERVTKWRDRLGSHGYRIGICWHGNKQGTVDRRSVPLSCFAPLAALPGVRLVGLQKGQGLEQLATLPPGMAIEMPREDFDEGPDAFLDTAGLMMNLDLVIASDTSLAHLAGALGRPVWLLLRKIPEWRWQAEGDTTPWYPTMRLFRQSRDHDWNEVFERVTAALVAARGGQSSIRSN